VTDSEITLDYLLSEEFNLEDKERSREVILAIDRSAAHSLFVNGRKATTFVFGDILKIESDRLTFEVTFKLVDGEGDFIGHIMPGNRACQIAAKNENRFEAYDTLFFFRTLRRSPHCRITVKIKVKRYEAL
jgi:hypothetical protein